MYVYETKRNKIERIGAGTTYFILQHCLPSPCPCAYFNLPNALLTHHYDSHSAMACIADVLDLDDVC